MFISQFILLHSCLSILVLDSSFSIHVYQSIHPSPFMFINPGLKFILPHSCLSVNSSFSIHVYQPIHPSLFIYINHNLGLTLLHSCLSIYLSFSIPLYQSIHPSTFMDSKLPPLSFITMYINARLRFINL